MPNKTVSSNSWAMFTIFTLIVAIFILPSDQNGNEHNPTVLYANSESIKSGQSWIEGMLGAFWIFLGSSKILLKYALIFGYIWFGFSISYCYINKRKLKKV